MADAWQLYRSEVPEELREKIRNDLLAAKVNGFDDFLNVSMGIVGYLLAGDIHPEVAREARSYLELCLTAVTAKAMKDSGATVTTSLTEKRIARANKSRGLLPSPSVVVDIDATTREYVPTWENKDE